MAGRGQRVFVTVGSTRFDALVAAVCRRDMIQLLMQKGYATVSLQMGNSPLTLEMLADLLGEESEKHSNLKLRLEEFLSDLGNQKKIKLNVCFKDQGNCELILFRYWPNLTEEMKMSDLVISHGGAGCCNEALNLGKPLITVINDALMHGHQTQLAERLESDGHSVTSSPDRLRDTVRGFEAGKLLPYAGGDVTRLWRYLDSKILHY